nr:immunoglobulin heavy chain junction region [Macaca mulatta]
CVRDVYGWGLDYW